MSNLWQPPPPRHAPSPPDVTNGWGKYVANALGEHGVWLTVFHDRLDHHERRIEKLETAKPAKAPPTDRTELWKEINSGLRTFLAVVLVIAFLAGKIDADAIEVLKKAASIAP